MKKESILFLVSALFITMLVFVSCTTDEDLNHFSDPQFHAYFDDKGNYIPSSMDSVDFHDPNFKPPPLTPPESIDNTTCGTCGTPMKDKQSVLPIPFDNCRTCGAAIPIIDGPTSTFLLCTICGADKNEPHVPVAPPFYDCPECGQPIHIEEPKSEPDSQQDPEPGYDYVICQTCHTTESEWNSSATIPYYNCPECGNAIPFIDNPNLCTICGANKNEPPDPISPPFYDCSECGNHIPIMYNPNLCTICGANKDEPPAPISPPFYDCSECGNHIPIEEPEPNA
jgi:hypothetical protein